MEQAIPYAKISSNTIIEGSGSGSNYTKMLRSPVKEKIEADNFEGRVSVSKASEKLSDQPM